LLLRPRLLPKPPNLLKLLLRLLLKLLPRLLLKPPSPLKLLLLRRPLPQNK